MILANSSRQKGLSLVELMVALTLGLVLLAGLMAFFFNTTKSMQMNQAQAESTSKAQLALARMVKELKEAHTEAPQLYASTPNWAQLPGLPYMAYEAQPYAAASGSVVLPAVPSARFFAAQNGETDKEYKWFPNPVLAPEESNSLTFYSAPAPQPGAVSVIQRITYRLDTLTDPEKPKLVREMQEPLTSSSTNFGASPQPLRVVIADNVERIQFRYPLMERQMAADAVNFDNQLQDMLTNEGNAVLQRYLNLSFRKVIHISLTMRGAKRGSDYATGVELETEVRLRNE